MELLNQEGMWLLLACPNSFGFPLAYWNRSDGQFQIAYWITTVRKRFRSVVQGVLPWLAHVPGGCIALNSSM